MIQLTVKLKFEEKQKTNVLLLSSPSSVLEVFRKSVSVAEPRLEKVRGEEGNVCYFLFSLSVCAAEVKKRRRKG